MKYNKVEKGKETAIEFQKPIATSEFSKLNMTNDILISLFENINNEDYINKKLNDLDFKKKFDRIYISHEEAGYNKPKHWIHMYDMGVLSNMSFSTADKTIWDNMIKELKKMANPKPFSDKTSYKCNRYIGKTYTFESYEPGNGVNLQLNDLYQIYVFKTSEK